MPAAPTMNDAADVSAANRAFYEAFESLDLDRMAEAWLREPHISCTHPGWERLLGWRSIMESWERIFAGTFAMKFEIVDERVHVAGDLAWVTCEEHIESRGYDGASFGRVEATNIFARRDGRWWIVHHHGSPLVREPGAEEIQ